MVYQSSNLVGMDGDRLQTVKRYMPRQIYITAVIYVISLYYGIQARQR